MNSLVCDTGPINYLVQIDLVDLLPHLFQHIWIPHSVHAELLAPAAPFAVREWAGKLPSWCQPHPTPDCPGLAFRGLSTTDVDVIRLAEAKQAAVLLDDLAARNVARQQGLPLIGTLGLLELAANKRLVHLPAAVANLRQTNARIAPELYEQVLKRNGFNI